MSWTYQYSTILSDLPYLNNNPTPTTFVDDTVITLRLTNTQTNQQTLEDCFTTVKDYMVANRLHLNPDKTTLLVVSKHPDRRKQLFLPTEKEDVWPSEHHKYLGIWVSDNLKWNHHLIDAKESLTKQLTTRLSALKKIRPFVSTKLMMQLTNGLFASKINFGAELWIGAPLYLRKKIQSLQLQACRITLGHHTMRWSTKQLLDGMKWNSVSSMLEIASSRLTHSIINRDIPENMSYRIKSNFNPNPQTTRATGDGRLGTKPKGFGRTNTTKNHYRANSYKIYSKIPSIITEIKNPKRFKIALKRYHKNPKNLPKIQKSK